MADEGVDLRKVLDHREGGTSATTISKAFDNGYRPALLKDLGKRGLSSGEVTKALDKGYSLSASGSFGHQAFPPTIFGTSQLISDITRRSRISSTEA